MADRQTVSPPAAILSARAARWLAVFGLAGLLNYSFLAVLAQRFIFGQGHTERPIVQVVVLLWAGWIAWVAASSVAQRYFVPASPTQPQTSSEMWTVILIVFLGCLYRLILIPTRPIQEADLYRYLWDGRLVVAGINPYRYTPAEIADRLWLIHQRQHRGQQVELDEDFRRLAIILDAERVHNHRLFQLALQHHGGMPTTYPPVAQAVFALAVWLSPDLSPVEERTTVLKAVLVAFDFATLLVILAILKDLQLPLSWSVIYAWCPLVLKEVANSGHVDSVAVFFCALAWWCCARQRWSLAGFSWALAVLTKAYPLALVPVWIGWLRMERERMAWLRFFGTAVLVLSAVAWLAIPSAAQRTPITGIAIFLREWEMNDALFHLTRQVLQCVLPDTWLEGLAEWGHWPRKVTHDSPEDLLALTGWTALTGGALANAIRQIGVLPVSVAFVLSYCLHAFVYLGVVSWISWRTVRAHRHTLGLVSDSVLVQGHRDWFSATFFALAWLFLLLPTGNPWYFLWALPWLVTCRRWAWYVLVGLLAHYYLYFWFVYHYPENGPTVWCSGLPGYRFFHEIWVWVEYLPFFVCLGLETWFRRRSRFGSKSSTSPTSS